MKNKRTEAKRNNETLTREAKIAELQQRIREVKAEKRQAVKRMKQITKQAEFENEIKKEIQARMQAISKKYLTGQKLTDEEVKLLFCNSAFHYNDINEMINCIVKIFENFVNIQIPEMKRSFIYLEKKTDLINEQLQLIKKHINKTLDK